MRYWGLQRRWFYQDNERLHARSFKFGKWLLEKELLKFTRVNWVICGNAVAELYNIFWRFLEQAALEDRTSQTTQISERYHSRAILANLIRLVPIPKLGDRFGF